MKPKYQTPTKCPKCGGELEDLWDGEPVSAFIGEWSDDRFRCAGQFMKCKDDVYSDGKHHFQWVTLSPSCGYFGLADFGIFPPDEDYQGK